MQFKYLDHTADAMFEAYGKTLEEAFANSALAMFNLLTDITKVKTETGFDLQLSADTKEKLLFDFFDELLFHLDTDHIIFSGFTAMKIEEDNGRQALRCTALGDKAENYDKHGDIKAPTYNEMKIKQGEEGWVIRAVVDI